jgi:hypothetical protein
LLGDNRFVRRALLIAGGGAAVALVLGFTAVSGSRGHASKPSLRVARAVPFRVEGRHFRVSERVRLTTGSHAARAMANGAGYFVIAIPGATRCDTLRVVARGSAGSYATVKLLPPLACIPVRASG